MIHHGVHTDQILLAYSYLFRALRLIDSTYLIQDIVCKPVSVCLRQREDAVHCIVDKLISASDENYDGLNGEECIDSVTELHQELLSSRPLEVEPLENEEIDADLVAEGLFTFNFYIILFNILIHILKIIFF